MKTFSGKPILQNEKELQQLLQFFQNKKIKSYLEVGVARGDTFYEVVTRMPKGSVAVAVDYPEKTWGISESQQDLEKAAAELRKQGYVVHLIFGDSRSPDIIKQAQEFGPFDGMLIDGDHSALGMVSDFINYSPMGKYIAFHDTANDMRTNRRGEKIDVPVFWELLKFTGAYEWEEYHEPKSNYGIGVLWKK